MNTNTKPKSKFSHLPPEDRQKVIDLCDQHTYHEVLEILPQPRPEGLQLQTSYSALCRFYTAHNEEARKTNSLAQCAQTVQLARQASHSGFRAAILTMLETRIFESLRRNLPVTDLADEFAVLKDFHKGFLSEEKWRTGENSPARAEWNEHLSTTSHHSHFDFLPVDQHGHPTAPAPLSDAEKLELSQLDEGSDQARATAIAKLDQTIAADGPDSAQNHADLLGLPQSLLRKRIEAHKQRLRSLGLTAVQAALAARQAALAPPAPTAQESRRLTPQNALDDFRKSADLAAQILQGATPPPDLSTSIHQKPPVNPHYPLKSS